MAKSTKFASEKDPVRLAPSKATLKVLFAKSGNECAFPGCAVNLIGENDLIVGQVCHICDALKGERYEESMSDEDRRNVSNLILLCPTHHVITKLKVDYSADALREMKKAHEGSVKTRKLRTIVPSEDVLGGFRDKVIERLDQLLNGIRSIEGKVGEVDKSIGKLGRKVSQIHASTGFRIEYVIETIRNLMEKRSYLTAIEELERHRSSKFDGLPDEDRYVLLSNIGFCNLEVGNYQTASENFITSFQYQRKNDKSLSLAAFGYLLRGNDSQAIKLARQAIKRNPDSENAYIVLINALQSTHSFESILYEVPTKLRELPNIAFNLGQTACNKGEFETGISYMRSSIKTESKHSWEFQACLASKLMISLEDNFEAVTKQIPEWKKEQLRKCIDLLTTAWDVAGGTELQQSHAWILLNRGSAKKLLDDLQGAIVDFKEACRLMPSDRVCHTALAITTMQVGSLDEAMEAVSKFEKINGEDEYKGFSATLFRAQLCIFASDFVKAIDILKNFVKTTHDESLRIDGYSLLMGCYQSLKKDQEALELCGFVLERHPDGYKLYHFAARSARILGQTELSKEMLENGRREAKSREREISTINLASEFFASGDPLSAANLLEPFVDKSLHSPLSEDLLRSLVHAGETARVLELCRSLRATQTGFEIAAANEIDIYARVGQLGRAIEICQEYIDRFPSNALFEARLALLQYESGHHGVAVSGLLKIPNIELLHYSIGFRIAEMFLSNGHADEGFQLAYLVRRRNYNIGDAHLRYVVLVAGKITSDEAPPKKIVEVGSAICIEEVDASTTTILLIDSDEEPLSNDERKPEDVLASAILGKTVGEIAEIRRVIAPQKFKITAILSRFSFAFLESLRMLAKTFHNVQGFFSGNAGGGEGIEGFLTMIRKDMDRREEFTNLLKKQYQHNRMPLGMVAGLMGKTSIEMWMSVVGAGGWGIYCTSAREYSLNMNRWRWFLAYSRGAVFDITSLLTIEAAGLYGIIDRLSGKKVISQSTWLELEAFIKELKAPDREGSFRLAKFRNEIIRIDKNEAETIALIDRMEGLQNWIKKEMEVLVVNEVLAVNWHEKAVQDRNFGKATVESILLAKEHSFDFLGEESLVREFAFQRYQIHGISVTIPLIMKQFENDIAIKREAQEKLAMICSLGYHLWPISPEVLLQCLEKSNYSGGYPFDHALTQLGSTTINIEQAMHWVSDFLKLFFLETTTPSLRLKITILILNYVDRTTSDRAYLRFLTNAIETKFALLQPQKDELFEIIQTHLFATRNIR